MFKPSFLYLLLFTVIFVSCSKNVKQDSELPVIQEVKVLNSSEEVKYEFPVSSKIKFFSRYTDDLELGSYRMEIHFAGDGHRHYKIEPFQEKATSLENWEFAVNGDLSGKEDTKTISRTVVEDAKASPYHAIFYATDDAGNFAEFNIVNFLVTRPDMPKIEYTSPDFNGLQLTPGGSLTISGSVIASKGVSKIQLIIRPIEISSEDEVVNKFITFDGSNSTELFNDVIPIPIDVTIGEYMILLLASDKSGSIGESLETFEIIE